MWGQAFLTKYKLCFKMPFNQDFDFFVLRIVPKYFKCHVM